MITYKIDKQSNTKINAELRDMTALLAEIAPTLQTLSALIVQHEETISTPTINEFRTELQRLIAEATVLGREITENAKKLVAVSDQAGKHLAAIEEHFGNVLREEQKPTTAVEA